MKIDAKKNLRNVQQALTRLERKGTRVEASAIRNPALRELAREVQTGCTATVSVRDMKRALQSVGADVREADGNADGMLTASEQRALSSLARRLLEAASGYKLAVESRRPVSTGCGGGSAPAPAPREPVEPREPVARTPVSTGCGSSPAPVRTRVNSGC